MTFNITTTLLQPSAPSCALFAQKSLIPFFSDAVLAIVFPTIVYAIAGGFFHLLDVYEFFIKFRIHPTEDEAKRNHVTKWQCFINVVRYHVMQISIGLLLNMGNGPTMIGDESCQVERMAHRISLARFSVPMSLGVLGIDAKRLAMRTQGTSAGLAQMLAGGSSSGQVLGQVAGFTALELLLAKILVYIGKPLLQYLVALTVVDTWIYFTHRLCHVNKTLYRLVHAQHHRIYVSFAYGAVYAHWLETLFLDILSFVLAGEIAQLSPRQSMLFGSFTTIKTISDHCGYVFPWDPLRLVNNNGATFHDLHHQSWGLKHNFSTYTVFWDNILRTSWADKAGAQARYKRVHEMTAKRSQDMTKNIAVTTRSIERDVAEGGGS